MKVFLELLKQYKEMLLLISSLVGAVFFVRDYFATKQEVEVLKCQADNGIALVESRFNVELLTKKVIGLKQEVENQEAASKSRRGQAKPDTTPLSLEIDRLKVELTREYDTQRRAVDNLKPGVCEKAVKK